MALGLSRQKKTTQFSSVELNQVLVGKIPSGLFVLTFAAGLTPGALLVSWVQQVSFDPLRLSVALNKERAPWGRIAESGRFCLNILGKQSRSALKAFWNPSKSNSSPLDQLATQPSRFGPIIEHAIGYLGCSVHRFVDAGDHRLVIADVLESGLMNTGDTSAVHVRTTGARY